MPTKKHTLLLNRTFQYFGIILIMAAMGGGYWYWKHAQAGLNINTSQEGTLSNGLVGYWPFDGNDISGTTAYDRSGNANNGTLTNGPTKAVGKSGQALSFNGTSQYIDAPCSSIMPSGNGPGSISVWVKPTADAALPVWFSKDTFGGSGAHLIIGDGVTSTLTNELITLYVSDGSNKVGYTTTSRTQLFDGNWHQIVILSTGAEYKIYLDGVSVPITVGSGSNNGNWAWWDEGTCQQYIGKTDGSGSYNGTYFSGSIDEPRIYNRALSTSEIWGLYQMGNPDHVNSADSQGDTLEKGLVGYWKLDDASGTSATDSSGNANTGTLTNGPTWTTGQIAGATDFDGTDDYIQIPSNTAYDSTVGTWSFWVKVDTIGGTTPDSILFRADPSGSFNGINMNVNTSFRFGFQVKNGSSIVVQGNDSKITANDGSWHHVVFVWTQISGGTNQLFIDGALSVSAVNSTAWNFNNQTVRLADATDNYWEILDGKLDEVRVYNRTLSSDEVAKLYKQTVPDNPETVGLVGYWPFNGPDVSGTTAYDRSGNANNGTLTNGPTVIPGRSGQAINFDGNNDYVSVPDANPIDFAYNQDFSIGFWSKFPNSQSSTSSATNSVIEKNNGSGRFPYAFRIYNQTAGGNAHRILFGRSDGTNSPSMVSNRTVNDNEWHYIVSTKSGSTLSMYIDGIFEKTGTDTTTTVTDNASPLYIGMMNGTLPLTGYVDELRIYNRALSASEIWDLYQMGNPDHVNSADSQGDPLEKGLVGYWKLDDGSGTSATDSSGNANTGTLTNGPTWTTGQIGGATSFDGTDDYINVGNQSALNLGINNFSISVWIFDTGATQNTLAINKRNNLNAAGYELLDSVTPGTHSFRVGDGTVNVTGYSVTGLNNGSWHLLTGVVDRSSQKLITYLDGFHIGTDVSITGMSSVDNTQAFQIGARGGATNFKGSLDEVRIYNRALSADEVAKLYKQTAPDNPDTGLIGYWPFNGPDVSGTTAYDRSGKGNNGTLTNGPRVIPGKAGQGLIFDGSDDRINYGNISALKPSFPFTVMAWVKGTGGAAFSNGKGDYFCSPATPYADNYSGIVFYMNGGVAGGNGGGQSASNRFERVASVSAADGQWHHIVAVLQAGNNISLYKDGSLNNGAYDDGTSTTIAYDTRPVLVGAAYECGYLYHANGTVDEVRIYNRALSAAEITAIYNASR